MSKSETSFKQSKTNFKMWNTKRILWLKFATSNPSKDDSTYFMRMTADTDTCWNDSTHFDNFGTHT